MVATKVRLLEFLLLLQFNASIFAFNCRATLENSEITFMEWKIFRKCLAEVNSERLPSNTSKNIWRILKNTFNGVENIPVETFMYLGYILTGIPMEELSNLSMERVEMVKALGAIHSSDNLQGFSEEQSALIAQKVQDEWLGKNSDTYSEFDLISMGEILCHLNVTVIEAVHADAYKNAAEWIGNIKNCPQDRLEALAKLAKHDDAFGEPSSWTKLVVNITGNILNGLPQTDIAAIDAEKLQLNRHYNKHHKVDTNNRRGSNGESTKSQNTSKVTLDAK